MFSSLPNSFYEALFKDENYEANCKKIQEMGPGYSGSLPWERKRLQLGFRAMNSLWKRDSVLR